MTSWENSKEHSSIGACIAKNRNVLLKLFKECSTHTSFDGEPKYVNFTQAKQALDSLLYENFTKKGVRIDDNKLACLLSVGLLQQRLSSNMPKVPPAFGTGFYEERPAKFDPFAGEMYDFHKLLNVYKDRYDLKVSVF